jgi:ABC-type lipoprotein release transport system permease subunit
VLRDTITYVALGLAAGVPLSLAAAGAIRGYLFGVAPEDGVTLATACAVVVGASLLAAYLPARRAPRVDPIAALRIE